MVLGIPILKHFREHTAILICNHVFVNFQEFQVFQHALRCAAFPVLGAPDPPSGSSPSPRCTPATGTLPKRYFSCSLYRGLHVDGPTWVS